MARQPSLLLTPFARGGCCPPRPAPSPHAPCGSKRARCGLLLMVAPPPSHLGKSEGGPGAPRPPPPRPSVGLAEAFMAPDGCHIPEPLPFMPQQGRPETYWEGPVTRQRAGPQCGGRALPDGASGRHGGAGWMAGPGAPNAKRKQRGPWPGSFGLSAPAPLPAGPGPQRSDGRRVSVRGEAQAACCCCCVYAQGPPI